MRLTLITILMVLFASSVQAGAVKTGHVETFETTQYKDPATTTLNWDTSLNRLHFQDFTIQLLGEVATTGTARATAVSGDIIIVADGTAGVKLVDTTDPTNPTIVGSVAVGGDAKDVIVDGNIAYVATGSGVVSVDISNTSAPGVVGSYATIGDAQGLARSGNVLYVADGTGGLTILGIYNPALPWFMGTSSLPVDARGVALRGNVAYIANGAAGVMTLDVTNPVPVVLLGSQATPGTAWDVVVDGRDLYVASGASGLVVVNVLAPASPSLAATLDTPGDAVGISRDGDYVYIADSASGLRTIDITVPSNPVPNSDFVGAGPVTGVSTNGNYGYVPDGAGLKVVELADPMPPLYVSETHDMDDYFEIEGDRLFMREWTTSRDFISVVDISDPLNPTNLTNITDPTHELGYFTVFGDYLFVAAQPDEPYGEPWKLRVYNIANLFSPLKIVDVGSLDWFRYLIVNDDYLYSSKYVFDISDPTAPSRAATLPHEVTWPAIHGNYLYGARGTSGSFSLAIYDITNPAVPVYLGAPLAVNWPQGIKPFGNHLFFGDLHYFYVMDISTPTAPVITFQDNIDSYGGTMPAITGDRLFTTPRNNIHEYDITNPGSPVRAQNYVNYYDYPYPENQLMHGDYLIIGNSTGQGTSFHLVQQRDHVYTDSVAQSLELDDTDINIVAATLTVSEDNPNNWFLSANGGTDWTSVQSGVTLRLPVAGNDLRWRAEFPIPASAGNTVASQVEVEWRFNSAVIDSVRDVAADQGGWVRLYFAASGYDLTGGSSFPISHYEIRRQADDQSVLTVFATTESHYTVRVPTLQDGVPEVYTVIAHSGGNSFVSPPDSASSSDNIPPGVPQAASVVRTEGGAELHWLPPIEHGVHVYHVYKGTSKEFVVGADHLVAETPETAWSDDAGPRAAIYKITALDDNRNEGEAATVEMPASAPDVPAQAALYQNQPNPFNPVTSIRYDVPEAAGHVTLRIYDVRGRTVRTLVSGPVDPGIRYAEWNGLDDHGNAVASGVYLYRLDARGVQRTRKLVLLR